MQKEKTITYNKACYNLTDGLYLEKGIKNTFDGIKDLRMYASSASMKEKKILVAKTLPDSFQHFPDKNITIVDLQSYIKYASTRYKSNENRAKGFFVQNIDITQISAEQKTILLKEFINNFEETPENIQILKQLTNSNPTILQFLTTESFLQTYIQKPENASKLKELIARNEDILTEDLISISKRSEALKIFENLLDNFATYKVTYLKDNNLTGKQMGEENIWQHFFENNKWIFGVALEMRCLLNIEKKLETDIVGASYFSNGRRIDAFLKTSLSQCVLVEIKPPSNSLLAEDVDHKGCFFPHKHLSLGVTQIQKTCRDLISVVKGDLEKKALYFAKPRTYLVIGNSKELLDDENKMTCFNLYRESLKEPEIITYDELYERAKFIIKDIEKAKVS